MLARRIWVLENGLVDQTGHHFTNALALRDECARRGLQTRFLVHRHAQAAVIGALGARPTFAFRPYDRASGDDLAGPMESLLIQAADFAEGFAAAATQGMTGEDLILVPMALQNELYGCALGLHRLAPQARPRLALNFVVENFLSSTPPALGVIAPLYRYAARALGREIAPERLLLTANGTRMAQRLAEVLARPVLELPMPKGYPEAAPPRPPGAVPCVALLGHSRPGKGFHLVPELVARRPGLRFVVQVSPESALSLWQDAAAAVERSTNAELLRGTLEPAVYHALMSRADIVLLPYDAARLPLRSSGIFSEAVAAGKVTVVPAGTWMEDHLRAGRAAGVVFEAFTAEAVCAALDRAAGQLAELQSQAHARAAAWRREQSVGAYLERILQAFGLAVAVEASTSGAETPTIPPSVLSLPPQ